MSASNNVTVSINGDSTGLMQALTMAQGGLQDFQDQVGQMGGATTAQMTAVGNAFSGFSQVGRSAIDIVTGPLDPLIDKLAQVRDRAGMVLETMTLWRGFDFVTQQIQSWTSALFELNNTMERTQTGWMFLFGTGQNASSMGIAQGLADYTKRESFNIPFTRQDMLQAITSLATTNPNASIVEKYLPLIADFASTRTNFAGQPLTLGQAAYSLVGAQEGYTRMLKYDLKINPEDLKKLGWNEKDPTTLFPALQKYADERHITGASKYIATHTWFGEKSSFEDRIQNFQLMAGQGLFKGMENDLNSFTTWWDAHQHQLDAFATMMGTNIANALKTASGAAKEFFSGWSSNGSIKELTSQVQHAITGAQSGYTRMLYYDLHVNAKDLEQYGYDPKKPTTLTNALEMYARLHHINLFTNHPLSLAGAAGYAAHGLLGDLGAGLGGLVQGGSGLLNAFVQPMRELANVLNNPAVKEGFAAVGHFLGELGKVRLTFSVDVLAGFFRGIAQSGAGQALEHLVQALDRMLQKSGPLSSFAGTLAQIAGGAIGTALTLIANGLTLIANGLAAVAANQAGLDLLKVGLAIVAGLIAGELVSSVIALTVSLWSAAAAEFAVMWPVYLLIAAIAALAFIIVEVVQHWHDITTALGHFKEAVGDFLGSAGKRIGDFFQGLGTRAHNALVSIQQAPGKFGAAISQAWDDHVTKPIETALATLITKALHWGENLIHNIADGIKNGLHWLQDAVNSALDVVSKKWQHSVPQEGPLKDEILWGTHMMQNIAAGMLKGIPYVAAASLQAANAIGVPLTNAAMLAGNISNISYGGMASTINIHASSYSYVQQIAREALAMKDQQEYLSSHAPGGFRAFGSMGV